MSDDAEAVANRVIEKLANILAALDVDDNELRRIATSAEVSRTPEQQLKSAIAQLLTRRR